MSHDVQVLPDLLIKRDNFEIIRDQIAGIIKANADHQYVLAQGGAMADTADQWQMRVFTEASNPWEQYRDWKPADGFPAPIVNIWYDNSNFNEPSSNTTDRQDSRSVYNVDVYAFGYARNEVTGGHTPGDVDAAFQCHRTMRFVRNFLMASQNVHLQMTGLIGQRWPQSITSFQPSLDAQHVQQIVAARLALRVRFNEFAPQTTPDTLEGVFLQVKRQDTGEVYFEYDRTL